MEAYMKKLLMLSALISLGALYAMDDGKPYLPAVPMVNEQTGQGYLVDMPDEMKAQITMAISEATTLPQAVKLIRALAVTNKKFNAVINSDATTRDLVHMLVAKFGGYHENVAMALGTRGAKQYVQLQSNTYLPQWNNASTLDKANALLTSGADIGYTNHWGSNPLQRIISSPVVDSDTRCILIKHLIAK